MKKRSAMKSRLLIGTVFCVCVSVTVEASLQESNPEKQKVQNPELRKELINRVKVDQDARKAYIAWAKKNNLLGTLGKNKFDLELLNKMQKVDSENREWLKKIVEKNGWPSKSMVGKEGAHNAWLLVQHADRDRKFQQKCLALMTAAPKGEVSGRDIAYLTDRVRLGTGKQQVYGTQLEFKNGKWKPQNLEDPEHVNQRRKKVGLDTFEKYIEEIKKVYGTPKPKKKKPMK